MKRFLKNIIILLVIVSVLILSVNKMYVMLDKADSDNINKFSSIPSKVTICNFGSSHGMYGYNYKDLSNKYSCFNFALSSQTLSYDYRMYQQYAENIDDNAVVFINVSYFSLFGTDEIEDDGFKAKNKRYYKILSSNLIKEYDASIDFLVKNFPSLCTEPSNLIKTLLGKSVDEKIWQSSSLDIDLQDSAERAVDRHIIKNKIDEGGKRIVNKGEIDALYSLIDVLQQRGITPILITTPFLVEYTNEIQQKSPYFYTEFREIISKVAEDTGAAYFDYSHDERFSANYSWFMDADHLNEEGARNFVNVLDKEIIIPLLN